MELWYLRLAYLNVFPDWFLRLAIRAGLHASLLASQTVSFEKEEARRQALIAKLKTSPIAIETDKPNVQHYEVPSDFFRLVLGKWLKYSCCYWPEGVRTLDEAEEAMLRLTCQRAGIRDGMRVLDLGCGWGAFSLWAARAYPNACITAVSNSRTQKEFIDARCQELGIRNIETITADVSNMDMAGSFDRVVSIEMFEHMKNYEVLLERISALLADDGKLFVHIFSNTQRAHEFDDSDPKSWIARTFFTGGLMPSDDLLPHFQRNLILEEHWRVGGLHYTRTLNAWFRRMRRQKKAILPILAATYGEKNKTRWWVNWKLFFLGCAETWRLRAGKDYIVSHYLFSRRS